MIVTPALVGLNVLVFLFCVFLSQNIMDIPARLLAALGGNFAPMVDRGEYWRFVSSMFLHGGLLHITFNMMALWQVGQLMERIYGPLRFLVLYFGAGILGSATSWWIHPGLSVGASGAIFGVYGGLLVFLLRHRTRIRPEVFAHLRSSTIAFIAYSLFAGFAIPGIDNSAHIGGLIGGFLLGLIL